MTSEMFIEIIGWKKQTFGHTTPLAEISHLREEVEELTRDIVQENLNRRLEFADCFLLLFGAAAADGMSYEDICACISEKMEINRNRVWGKPDDRGVVKHVEQEKEHIET